MQIHTLIRCGTMTQSTARNDKSVRMNAVLSVMTDFPTSLVVRSPPAFQRRAFITLLYILLLSIHYTQ